MTTPLVSIILSTYNGNEKWISESINSVLNQTYNNINFIIINDASNNNVDYSINSIIKNDNRVIYINNSQWSKGYYVKLLNQGINLSKGDYITRIDDDDIWEDRNKLQKQIDFMELNKDYGLCGTGVIFIDENGKIIGNLKMEGDNNKIKNNLPFANQFVHSSIMIRKNILNKIGLYDENSCCLYTEDYDLWLRIGKDYKLHNIQEYCVKYRIRTGSISGKHNLQQEINSFKIYLKYRKYYPNEVKGVIYRFFRLCINITIIPISKKIGIYKLISNFRRKYILKNKYGK